MFLFYLEFEESCSGLSQATISARNWKDRGSVAIFSTVLNNKNAKIWQKCIKKTLAKTLSISKKFARVAGHTF